MSTIAKDSGGQDFDPIPAGMHHAICYGVVDLGTQPNFNPAFRPKKKICLIWELPFERFDFEKDGVKKNLPRSISMTYTNSLSPKGKLRPMLTSWRGRQFTPEELKAFDVVKVVGANCLLNITHSEKLRDGTTKTYSNISSVSPLMKGTQSAKGENPPLVFDLDRNPGTISFPTNMPEWLQKKILGSAEVLARNTTQRATPSDAQMANLEPGTGEEDIPF